MRHEGLVSRISIPSGNFICESVSPGQDLLPVPWLFETPSRKDIIRIAKDDDINSFLLCFPIPSERQANTIDIEYAVYSTSPACTAGIPIKLEDSITFRKTQVIMFAGIEITDCIQIDGKDTNASPRYRSAITGSQRRILGINDRSGTLPKKSRINGSVNN